MSVSDRARKALEHLGMTANEIKAYAALLKSGGGTAEEMSKAAGVPYSKIYDILGSLVRGGWASSDDSRPTKYAAKAPSDGLDATRQRREEQYKADYEAVAGELGPIYEKTGSSEKPEIWFLRGAGSITSKILEMAGSCKSEVLIAVPEAGKEMVKQALPKLRRLHEGGVRVTILASDEIDIELLKMLARVASVRTRGGLFGGGIISDRQQVVILLRQGSGSAEAPETAAVWADHAGLAAFAHEYFEYLIKESEEVK